MSQSVGQWLTEIGLGQYSDAFAQNGIDWSVLPELDNDTLKEVGVALVGHRLAILRAIREMQAETTALAKRTTSDDATSAEVHAERRQLTVMFCDLVGSTGLSGQLDPEDLRDVVRAYHEAAENVIHQYDGRIAQYLGDGLLVYFGYPVAHEDDAQRGVYAGIGIPKAIAELNQRLMRTYAVQLAVRIGIHTGPVVVGEVGSDRHLENLAVGETPNIAARLQELVDPGRVLISESTRRLLGERFELEAVGEHSLKGLGSKSSAYIVHGERQTQTRFLAGQNAATSDMVGRQQELALLQARWASAKAGDGQVVVVTGDAGIGKSRVIDALSSALATDDHEHIVFQCSPYHAGSPLHPVIKQLEFAAGFDPDDNSQTRLNKIESLFVDDGSDSKIHLIAGLLGLSEAAKTRFGSLKIRPEQRRQQTLSSLIDYLIDRAKHRPLLFILEDAHWIDPTTLELIDSALDAIGAHRILMTITARTSFTHDFGGHPTVSNLLINRLTKSQIASMIGNLTDGKALPPQLLNDIVAKTDGVPLYVEEFTKTILESGLLHETDQGYTTEKSVNQLSIPSSLQDSLMARLDRMQPIKTVAQMAACIGRDFSHPVIQAISPLTTDELSQALNQLVAAGLIFKHGTSPQAQYMFKHALVRDAAYESLLKSRRQAIHEDLFKHFKTDKAAAPEILAYHATEASRPQEAATFWEQAGDLAARRIALNEAIGFFERARHSVQALSSSEASAQRELNILVKLARTATFRFGWSHPMTVKLIEEELDLLEKLGDTPRWFAIRSEKWTAHFISADHKAGLDEATTMCAQAEQGSDRKYKLSAYRHRAVSKSMLGMFDAAAQDFDLAFRFVDANEPVNTPKDSIDPVVGLRLYAALNLQWRGQAEQAWAMLEGIEEQTRAAGNIPTYVTTLAHISWLHLESRIPNGLQVNALEREITEKYDLKLWSSTAVLSHGILLSQQGDYANACDVLERGLELARQSHNRLARAGYCCWYAYALAAVGRHNESTASSDTALKIIHKGTERWGTAENLRLLAARDYWQRNEANTALQTLERALSIASEQGARLFELRITRTMSQLLFETRQRTRALELLEPYVTNFPASGQMLPDWKSGQQMLQTLRN